MKSSVERNGFILLNAVLGGDVVAELIAFVEAELLPGVGRGGVRNLLASETMRELAGCNAVRALVEPVLGVGWFPVRGILFDKTADANWKVPWHQDVTIEVRERREVAGFGPWSVKQGVVHVQAPAEVLEGMLTVRLHLDACPAENGALRVIAGTHTLGKISETRIAEMGREAEATVCAVGAGGALVMRPLLVHASSAASVAGHRRVLHFDFAAGELAGGLEWAEQGTTPR